MLSKLCAFRLFPVQKIDAKALRNLLVNPLCTAVESPEDDDFAIPSLANWLESEASESDADKISKVLKENKYGSPKDAVIALDRRVSELSPNAALERVLKRFDNDWVSAFGVFKWAESQKGYNHTPELYDSMVDILGKCRRFDLMWELIEEMRNPSSKGLVSLNTMAKAMRRLVRARMCEEAVEAFRGLERFGVSKDIFALNVLMEILTKENNVELAEGVFLESKESIPPNDRTFNVLIHGWCRAGRLEKARKTMEDMEKHNGFPPNVYTYNCFVEAHVRRKDYHAVRSVLREMKGKGLKPSSVTRTIVIYGLGKAVQVDEALKTYERARKNGFSELDVGFFNSAIFVLGKAGRLRNARRVFDDMTERGVAPNAKTYTSLISCACEHSMEETALTLLKKMEENEIGPSIDAYSALFKMFSKTRRVKMVRFLLDHMFRNDVSATVGTYSILVTGLCKSGKLDEACGFFEEMVSKGMVMEESQYQRLRKKLEAENMIEAKEKVEKLMSRAKQSLC